MFDRLYAALLVPVWLVLDLFGGLGHWGKQDDGSRMGRPDAGCGHRGREIPRGAGSTPSDRGPGDDARAGHAQSRTRTGRVPSSNLGLPAVVGGILLWAIWKWIEWLNS